MPYLTDALESIDATLEELDDDRRRLQLARDVLRPPKVVDVGAGEKYRLEPKPGLLAAIGGLRLSFPSISFDGVSGGAIVYGSAEAELTDTAAEPELTDEDAEPTPTEIEEAESRNAPPSSEEEKSEQAPAPPPSRPTGGGRREELEAIVLAHPEGITVTEARSELEEPCDPSRVSELLRQLAKAGKVVDVELQPGNRRAGIRYFPPGSAPAKTSTGVVGGKLPASRPARRSTSTRPDPAAESSATTATRHDRSVLTAIEKAESPLAPGEICTKTKLGSDNVFAALERLLEADRIAALAGKPPLYRAVPA